MENFYKNILDNLLEGVYFVDRTRTILYWNKGAERISGFTAEEVIGKRCSDNILNHVNSEGVVLCLALCPLAHTINDGRPRQADIFLHHKQGHRVPVIVNTIPLYDENNKIVGAIESFTDNSALSTTIERVQLLSEIAFKDELTGVGNRRYLEMKLRSGLIEVKEYQARIGVLFYDIDHFKSINDTYGHDVGDQILRMVANTLDHNVRSVDVVGRWGGDEFIVLLQNVDEEKATAAGEKLLNLIGQSFLGIEEANLSAAVSGGGTLMRKEDVPREIFNRVDRLLYQSKRQGRNRFIFSG
jgi:diguanylate cyclase (GGDEF)-like protein/PAS domain S-box-containing protein